MPVWDLTTRINWAVILQDRRIAVRVADANLPANKYRYKPIPPIFATPSTNTLLIGTFSETAKPSWFLGATASQYLYVSPSSSIEFTTGVQTDHIVKLGLNRLTLVEFKNYDVSPYLLKLDIPYWLEDVYVEVWQYGGSDNTNSDDIILRLNSIESKIDATHTP